MTHCVLKYGCSIMVAVVLVTNGAWWYSQRSTSPTAAPASAAPDRNAGMTQQEAPYDAMAALVLPFGYSLEEHFAITEDGFILRLFRLGATHRRGPPTSRDPATRRDPTDTNGSSVTATTATTTTTTTTTTFTADATTTSDILDPRSPAGTIDQHPLTGANGTITATSPTSASGSSSSSSSSSSSRSSSSSSRGPVVFLHHPLMGSSVDWVVMGPGRSLAFILADAGYDVWLHNVRGNRFSRNHTALDPDAPGDLDAFWSYSWDEHVALDLPASLDLVASVTGQQEGMLFVGYSQGTTVGLAALASQPRVSRRVAAAALLAPVAFVSHMTSPLFRIMAQWRLERFFRLVGLHEYGGHHPEAARVSASFCGRHPRPCTAYLELLCGTNPIPGGNVDPGLLPAIMTHLPSGTSVQNMAHWGQVVRESDPMRLPYFDYGTDCSNPAPPRAAAARTGGQHPCNQVAYNSSRPPAYPLSSITTPLALFSGGHDSLADPVDVALLLSALQRGAAEGGGPVVQLHHHEPDYGHLDFGVGHDAADRIYPLLLAFLRQFTPGAQHAAAAA